MTQSPEMSELVALRRELHAHAELSGEESETGGIVRRYLEAREPDQFISGLGGTGLAAVFDGRHDGPTVMLRAELDGVPVEETNDFVYLSQRPGVSHTCGHDGHATILAGLAARLHRRRPAKGRVALLFQPAEETGRGARALIEDERFELIKPDWVFALHNLPGETFGEIQIRNGPFAAGSVGAILRLRGRTSHAAYPEQGTSPALAVAELIRELGELPDALRPNDGIAMLTVVHARIGEPAFGTSPGEAEVMATLRSDREEILGDLQGRIVAAAERTAGAHGLDLECSWADEFPVTINHPEAVALVEAAAEAGGVTVVRRDRAYPWSEDFGWFTRRFKGAIFGLGAGSDAPALHSPRYDFPDEMIPLGIGLFEGVIERTLG
jgi:amidohydrolase